MTEEAIFNQNTGLMVRRHGTHRSQPVFCPSAHKENPESERERESVCVCVCGCWLGDFGWDLERALSTPIADPPRSHPVPLLWLLARVRRW